MCWNLRQSLPEDRDADVDWRMAMRSRAATRSADAGRDICLVFKDAMEEQLFQLARQQVRREWRLLRRARDSEAVASMIRDHREQIDAYWLRALGPGRPAAPEECPETQTLIRLVGSWRRMHEWVGRFFGREEFEEPAIGRQEDLLVHFALGHFGRRQPYSQLPDRLQRDVQFFFGSITKARNAGKRALFATGDRARLEEAAVFCHDELGIGVLNDDHDLTFHQSVLGECLPLIRIFVGCALQLFGDAGSVDLIKVICGRGRSRFWCTTTSRGRRRLGWLSGSRLICRGCGWASSTMWAGTSRRRWQRIETGSISGDDGSEARRLRVATQCAVSG